MIIKHDVWGHVIEVSPKSFVETTRDDIIEALDRYTFCEHHEQYPYFPLYEQVSKDVKESFFTNKDNYNSYTKNPWKIIDGEDFDECYQWL